MRARRARQFSKILASYERCFGLDSENLEIFLDHTFVRQALINHVNIYDSIANMVGRGIRLVTSSCVMAECQALGPLFSGVLRILEGFIALKCRHEYNPAFGAAWCIRKRIRTSRKHSKHFGRLKKGEKCFLFALASNDPQLQTLARNVPGMPILFISQRCVNTEPIPESTQHIMDNMVSQSLSMNEHELKRLHCIEDKFGLQKDSNLERKKKSRGPSGPNPLSCRKKQSSSLAAAPAVHEMRRQRKRKKTHRALHKTWALRRVLNIFTGTSSTNMHISVSSSSPAVLSTL